MTNQRLPLFRPEVQQSKRHEWLGQVILMRPLSFSFLSLFAVVSACGLLSFLVFSEYTKRTQVTGLLTPDAGLIKIQSPQAGVIVERRVKEGQQVQAGDILFVLSAELKLATAKPGSTSSDSNALMVDSLRARQHSLRQETTQQISIADKQAQQLHRTIAGLQAEQAQLAQEIATQNNRVSSAQTQYQRHQQLAEKSYISSLALQQKHDELLDQQGRLQTMQRNSLSLARELSNAQAELAALPDKSRREKNQLDRQALELEQQAVNLQAHNQFLVTAPQAGTVTAILADPGQMAGNQTLLTILPAHAHLEAQLYVPSRAAGFIEAGQKVLIRYAAYPYQKFGQYQGVVQDVSRTALAQSDLPPSLSGSAANDGMYRVRVALSQQAITAYGKPQALSAGMQLEADILQERRSLIEWVLEPLYSLRGKVT